jgi:hypothetical protein
MTGKAIYGAVIQAATATLPPGISRHTKLLEPGLTQTKLITALAISRHETGIPSNAINLGSCSAGTSFACPEAVGAESVPRHSSVPLACHEAATADESVTRHCFSTRYKQLLETGITQTKQTTDAASTRYKARTRSVARERFLIGTPKRLETALTQSKQTSEVISNRYKNRGLLDVPAPYEQTKRGAGRMPTIR